jgi:hypothetical protein
VAVPEITILRDQEHAALIDKRADRRITRPLTVEHAVHVRRIDATFAQPVDESKRDMNVAENAHQAT